MNKKALITAAVFIGVGLIGLIPCLLSSVPYFTNLVVNAQQNAKETTALNEVGTVEKEVTQIVINSEDVDVRVVPSTSDKVEIYKSESSYTDINVTYSYKESEKQVTIDQTGINYTNFMQNIKTNQIDTFIQDVITQSMSNVYEYIEIRVPNEVNLVVSSNYEHVIIDKDVVKENISFTTYNGDISFEDSNKSKQLGKLIVKSEGEIDLAVDELVGFNEVTVEAREADIDGTRLYSTVTVNDGYPVNTMSIIANEIDIYTTMPIAKTVELNGKQNQYGSIEVSMPIEQFDITWEIMSNDYPIEFDSMHDENHFETNQHVFNGKLGNGTDLPSTIKINAPNQEVEITDYL